MRGLGEVGVEGGGQGSSQGEGEGVGWSGSGGGGWGADRSSKGKIATRKAQSLCCCLYCNRHTACTP